MLPFLRCNPLCASINQQTESRTIQWCVSERMGGLCLGKRQRTHMCRVRRRKDNAMLYGQERALQKKMMTKTTTTKGGKEEEKKNRWRAVKYGEHCYVSYPWDCGHPQIWFCHNSRYIIAVAVAAAETCYCDCRLWATSATENWKGERERERDNTTDEPVIEDGDDIEC